MTYPIATIGDLGVDAVSCGCTNGPRSTNAGIGELQPESEALTLLTAGFPLPTVFPKDVDAYKARINPDFIATDALVTRCANLSSPEAVAWGDFFTSWEDFARTPTPTLASWESHLATTKEFEKKLAEWQTKLIPICGPLPSPVIKPPGTEVPWGKIAIGLVAVAAVGAIGYGLVRGFGAARSPAKQNFQRGSQFLIDQQGGDYALFGEQEQKASKALAKRR